MQYLDQPSVESERMSSDSDSGRFSITANASQEEMKIVGAGLHNYVREYIRARKYTPGRAINLVVKDKDKVVGGLLAWTPIMNLAIEQIWLDEGYRGLGYGTKLVLEAERIAKENKCIACQTYALSFQAPEFFQKLGYKVFGVDDGYPDPIKEYYFIKKFA